MRKQQTNTNVLVSARSHVSIGTAKPLWITLPVIFDGISQIIPTSSNVCKILVFVCRIALSGWERQFWHESDSLLFMIFQILTPGRPSDGTKSLAPGIFWELGMRMLSTFPWGLRMAILLLCDIPQLPKVPQLPTTRVILCLARPFGIYRGFGSTSKHFPEIDWRTWWRT